jgi:hypothetical protein
MRASFVSFAFTYVIYNKPNLLNFLKFILIKCNLISEEYDLNYSSSSSSSSSSSFKYQASWPVPVPNLFSETYESIGQLVRLLGRGIGPTHDLYLHDMNYFNDKIKKDEMRRGSM